MGLAVSGGCNEQDGRNGYISAKGYKLYAEVVGDMSYFSELLDEMLGQHGLRATDICTELNMGKSYFSKLRNGTQLPSNMEIVRRLADAMRLSIQEKEVFFDAYKVSRFGISYLSMTESVQKLLLSNFEHPKQETPEVVQCAPLVHGQFIGNKGRVILGIRQMLQQTDGMVKLLYQPECDDICGVIREELALHHRKCSWLLYLNNVNTASPDNLRLFFNAVPLMMNGVAMRYSYINMRSFYEYSLFPFMLITDSAVMVISQDCGNAMYFQTEESVAYYQKQFSMRYQKAAVLGKAFSDVEEFLDGYDEIFPMEEPQKPCDFYVVERPPCVIHEGDAKLIYNHMADKPEKGVLTKKYMEFLFYHLQSVKKTYAVFTKEGMREFFEAEEYYEFNKQVSQPISLQLRKKCFRQLIGHAEKEERLEPNMMLSAFLDHSCIHAINIWSDGRMIIMLNLENAYRILVLKESSLAASLISYLNFLKESGLVLSKEDTLKMMHSAWEKYGNSGA